MSKFDLSSLRGGGVKVGSGLLNAVSAAEKQKLDIRYVDEKDIIDNDKNFYSVDDIGTLAQSIKTAGLEQPPVVTLVEDGTYRLISGHRRLAAIRALKDAGEWDKPVPCIVTDTSRIDLPLSDDDKELYALLITNHESRNYTEADTAEEIKALTYLYGKLREKGVKEITFGTKADGTPDVRQIAGIRTSELIARDAGISKGMQSQYGKIEHGGSDDLKSAFSAGKISVTAAAEASDMSDEKQNEMLEDFQDSGEEKIFPEHVKKWKREHEERMILMRDDLLTVVDKIPENGLSVTETDYKSILATIKTLDKYIVRALKAT